MSSPMWADPPIVTWSQCLLESFHHWTGRDLLIRIGSPEDQARDLFRAPFVVVSHGMQADPILNYGNQVALDLWDMTWARLTSTPSRLTAEPMNREERARMLAVAAIQGYFTGYRGVRISATGARFLVEDATVWNVVDVSGALIGQAAMFARWTPIGEGSQKGT